MREPLTWAALGRRRRYRRMMRALQRLDRYDAALAPGRPPQAAVRGRGLSWSTIALALLVLAVVVGLARPGSLSSLLEVAQGTRARAAGLPPVPEDAAPTPLGTPAPVPDPTAGGYSFLATEGDRPITYDPCRPLRLVVNPAGAPEQGSALVAEAVTEVAAATGLQLVVEGDTDEVPADGREPHQPDRYGDRWAPVLVAWSAPGAHPALAGDVAGFAGSVQVDPGTGAGPRYVTGSVVLDAPQLAGVLAGPDGRARARGVVMHELGHVVGLGHVEDPGELMNAAGVGQPGFGPGDRNGLAQLGSGPCRHDT